MNRREFLEKSCLAGLTVVAGGMLINTVGLSTLKAKTRVIEGNKEIPINLEDAPDLQPVGGAYHLELEDIDKDLIIAHVGENEYVAVDIKCTHKGCDVTYEHADKVFNCPCHGSQFKLTGEPIKGPAKKPLMSYQTKLQDKEVIITIPSEEKQ